MASNLRQLTAFRPTPQVPLFLLPLPALVVGALLALGQF
jgi:hypothetical protein